MKNFTYLFLALFVQCLFIKKSYGLDGNYLFHDPSTIVKEGGKYWIFSTGDGITTAYSDDLYRWTEIQQPVFAKGTWPAWINTAVPGFAGRFWAPDCIFMNGKYYLYYSCSLPHSSRSAIGLATNPTLDPNNSNYKWTDHGPVVSSSSNNDFNAIDPAIFKDDNGDVYLTYGSFFNGIAMVKLDPLTGKPAPGNSVVKVAGSSVGQYDWEAAYVFKNGSYYYLVANRGHCCRDLSSTYFLVTGRSKNPTGPFLDDNNIDLNNGGGKHLLATSGKYIGPGHFGLLRQNGANFVSMHYYDGENLGKNTLDIGSLKFIDDWPVFTRDWIPAGRYRITNQHSGLVWDSWGCNGQYLEAVAQAEWHAYLCQQWDFAPLGDGVYKIVNAREYGTVDAMRNSFLLARLQIVPWLNNSSQKFKIDRAADGSYLLTSLNIPRLIEIPSASTASGTFLGLWSYTGHSCQRWYINAPGSEVGNPVNSLFVVK